MTIMTMIQLGPLVEKAIEKEFPHKWISLANLAGLEYEHNEDSKEVTLFFGNDEISITEEGLISTTVTVSTDLITQIIIQALQSLKKENE